MSAIGGIACFRGEGGRLDKLNRMRLALSLRGRSRSSAFIDGACGMFFNSSRADAFEYTEEAQPKICERRGHSFALCIDGEGIDTSAAMERYMIRGSELPSLTGGPFALALYDGERGLIMLARDKKGRRPLYYRIDNGVLYFASEIKGITAATDGYTEIDGGALAYHLLSPAGVGRASRIYADVSEVLPGECVIFTAVGMSRFFYRDLPDSAKLKRGRGGGTSSRRRELITAYSGELNENKLSEYLCSALTAFDMPCFDAYMPSLMELLAACADSGREELIFQDPTRRASLYYSYEREDRLGNLYGIRARGVPIDGPTLSPRGLYGCICERYASLGREDHMLLAAILGQARYRELSGHLLLRGAKQKEDTDEAVRILGMLCQTVEWAHSQDLVIRGGDIGTLDCGA